MADQETSYGNTALVFGGLWFAVSYGLQAIAGPWFILSLSRDLSSQFLGGSFYASAVFWGGMAAGFIALILVGFATFAQEPRTFIWAAAAFVIANLVAMVMSHQRAREFILDGLLGLEERSVQPQETMFLFFAVVLALGTVAIGWMVWASSKAQKPQ